MNCQSFQEQLYEYVEDSLGPEAKASAEEHLNVCASCRELLRHEQRASGVLSANLRDAVAELKLGSEVVNRLRRTLETERLANLEEPVPAWWRTGLLWRLAAGLGLVAAVAAVGLWIGNRNGSAQLTKDEEPKGFIAVEASYVVPVFTSHREGNLVVDAITFQTNYVRQTLWAAATLQPPSRVQERKNSL